MSRSRNVFLDVEAAGGSDDSEEEADQEFLQEDHAHHSTAEESQAPVTFPTTRAAEEEEDETRWSDLLARARARADTQNNPLAGSIFGIVGLELQEGELLWEITCKVGSEQAMINAIQKRALHSSSGEPIASALSVTVPGRIYAKARKYEQVIKLSRSFGAFHRSKVRPIPAEDILNILSPSPSSHVHGSWARVRGSESEWSRYVGDTGLITQVDGRDKCHLALIPRLALNGAEEGQSRPPQMLVSRRGLEVMGTVKDELFGRYVWKGQTFSAEGIQLVHLDDISILALLEPLPTSAELAIFRSTSLLSPEKAARTEQQMEQAHMNIGDRVKVVSGPYLHLIGEVRGMKENEVSVFLSSQDIVEDMPKDSVRAAFRVADRVRILDGQYKGLVGWIIAVSESERALRVLDVEAAMQATVSMTDVEFHSPDCIIALQPREQCPKWGQLGERNPNDVYTSKRVMVIGNHELKGYKGLIKSTTPDGYAFLQLDIRLQQITRVKLMDLACLAHQDNRKHRLQEKQIPLLTVARPLHSPGPIPSASTQSLALIPNLVGLTPAWDPSESSHMQSDTSPAWDPLSRSPYTNNSTRPIHWLDDPGLQRLRLKLIMSGSTIQSPCFEFLGVEDDLVKVRDKANVKLLAFDSVSPLPPTSRGELVTPRSGKMQGVYFKVIQIRENACLVRKPGTKPTKNNPDAEFTLTDLVQVYPAFR